MKDEDDDPARPSGSGQEQVHEAALPLSNIAQLKQVRRVSEDPIVFRRAGGAAGPRPFRIRSLSARRGD